MQLSKCTLPSLLAAREPSTSIAFAGLSTRHEPRPSLAPVQVSSVAVKLGWANTVHDPPSSLLPAAPPPPLSLAPPPPLPVHKTHVTQELKELQPVQQQVEPEEPAQQPATRHHAADLRRVWHAPRPDHSKLTSSITACMTCSQLLSIIQMNQGYLNHINLAAALTRTARLFRQTGMRPLDSRIGSSHLIPTLVQELRNMMALLQPRAIATSLHALSTLDVRDRELYAELGHLAERHMPEFTSQGLANMLWAYAHSGCLPTGRWMELCTAACNNKLTLFSAQDLSMTMWALARLRYKLSTDKQQRFLDHALHVMPQASPQALSMMAYGLVFAHHHPGPTWLSAFECQLLAAPGLNKFTPQGVSTTLWALAKLSHTPSPALTQAIHQHITAKSLQGYNGIDLATLYNALAKMGIQLSSKALNGLRARFQVSMFTMEANQLANSSLAMAQLCTTHPGHPPPSIHLLNKLLSAIYMKLHMFNANDLSMVTQALARLRCHLPATFLHSLQQRIEQLGVQFEPQDISLTLWGLQRLGVTPSANLMMEFFLATNQRLSSFKPAELSIMIWALAQARFRPDKPWVEEFLHSTFPRLPQFSPQSLANMILALSQLSIRPTPAWLYAFVKAADTALPSCGVQDLQGLVQGLDAMNAPPQGLQLQKIDEFLARARAALDVVKSTQQHTTLDMQEQLDVAFEALQDPTELNGHAVVNGVNGHSLDAGLMDGMGWVEAGMVLRDAGGGSGSVGGAAPAGVNGTAVKRGGRRKSRKGKSSAAGAAGQQQQPAAQASTVPDVKSKPGKKQGGGGTAAVVVAGDAAGGEVVVAKGGGMKVGRGAQRRAASPRSRRQHTAAAVKLAKAAGSGLVAPQQAALLATTTGVQPASQ